MRQMIVCSILYSIKCIQACNIHAKGRVEKDEYASFYDYKVWALPPHNTDWWEFIDLLGTRDPYTTPSIPPPSRDDEPDFPWPGLGYGQSYFEPPRDSYIESYIGQSPACMFPPDSGNGSSRYLRWYYNIQSDRCETFTYSGMGGNVNKFISWWRCNEICQKPAKRPCCPDGNIDYYKFLKTPDFRS